MAYTPAYKETWHATGFKASKKKGRLIPVERYVSGPIFPFFILAELSTYDGFQEFAEWVGLNGFIYLLDVPKRREMFSKDFKDFTKLSNKYHIRSCEGKFSLDVERIISEKLVPDSYIREFYEHIRTDLMIEQKIMATFYGLFIYSRNRNSPFARYPHLTFDRLYKTVSRHLTLVKVIAQQPAILNYNDFSKNKITWSFSYESLPARCYMEMIDMIDNKEKVKECAYCEKLFIPARKNEIFCKRLAPGYRRPGEERTCKQIGPQRRFFKEKSKDDMKWIKQKKKFQNRLLYLKKKGDRKEYRKVEREFKKWERENISSI